MSRPVDFVVLGLLSGAGGEREACPATKSIGLRVSERMRLMKIGSFCLCLLLAGTGWAQDKVRPRDNERVVQHLTNRIGAAEDDDIWFIRENGKFGFIDRTGKTVIPCIYENTWGFTEGLAGVKLEGKLGFIDKTGRMVIAPQWVDGYAFFEGLAWVRVDGQYAFIDKTGAVVIKPQPFEDIAFGFSDGLCAVKREGKWGYIDRAGRMAIEPQFDTATKFRNGIAQTKQGGKYLWIDKRGKAIWREK